MSLELIEFTNNPESPLAKALLREPHIIAAMRRHLMQTNQDIASTTSQPYPYNIAT